MEAIFEGLLSVACELVFQVVAELLAELGFHALAGTLRERAHPVVSMFGYTVLGGLLGGLSVLLIPHHLLRDPVLAMVSLVVSPAVAGLAMAGVGMLRARRGQPLIRLDSFGCGYLFALAFALARWWLASAA